MKRRLLAGLATATAVAASLVVGSAGSVAAAQSPLAPITEAQRSGGVTPNSALKPPYDVLKVDETKNKIVTTVKGVGKQVYYCNTATNLYVLREPVAGLFALRGLPVGIHGFVTSGSGGNPGSGPFWTGFDGSRVNGSGAVSVPAPNSAKDIAWLRLVGASVPNAPGAFANISFIQRIDTSGGVAPTSCDASSPQTISLDYLTNYVFWAPK